MFTTKLPDEMAAYAEERLYTANHISNMIPKIRKDRLLYVTIVAQGYLCYL